MSGLTNLALAAHFASELSKLLRIISRDYQALVDSVHVDDSGQEEEELVQGFEGSAAEEEGEGTLVGIPVFLLTYPRRL